MNAQEARTEGVPLATTNEQTDHRAGALGAARERAGTSWFAALSLGLLAAQSPVCVYAQAAVGQSSNDGVQLLEEVIVTAERRAANAQDVPISMSVFSRETIQQYIKDPLELANLTPNFQISAATPGAATVSMRGLGNAERSDIQASMSILTYYDGIAAGAPFVASLPVWDLDRIEVLRGPQGTLFGRNAVGGLIQYISAAPTEEFEGFGELTYGEFDLMRFEGAISGALTDKVKARVSGLWLDRGGNVADTFSGSEYGDRQWSGARAIVDWQLTDDFDARAKAQHFESEVDMSPLFNAAPAELMPANVLAWINALGADPNLERNSEFDTMRAGRPSTHDYDLDLFELDLNYDFGAVGLSAVAGYMQGDSLTNSRLILYPAPLFDQLAPSSLEQWSGEVRLTSQTDHSLQWIAGAFYQESEETFRRALDQTALTRDLDGDRRTRHNPNSPEDLLDGLIPNHRFSNVMGDAGNDQDFETYAIFLHTTYQWTDRLTTTQAARFTHEEKSMNHRFPALFEFPVSASVTPGTLEQFADFVRFAGLTPAQQRAEAVTIISDPNTVDANGNVVPFVTVADADEVTWRFAADYRLTDDALLYASVSKGFKGAIFSILASPTTAVSAEPERSTVYEVGAKSEWWSNRLQLNVSVFYDDHTDYQTTQFVTQPNGLALSILDNLPEVEIYGGELQLVVAPVRNLLITTNLGLVESEITKVLPQNDGDLGKELPFAEDLSFSGMVRYDLPTALGSFSPQVSWRYRGEYWSSKLNSDVLGKRGGFWTADARLAYESLDGKLYGLLYLKNMFDEVEPLLSQSNLSLGSSLSIVNEGRNWGVSVGYRF